MKVPNKLFVSTENSRGLKVKIKYSKDALKFLSKLDKKSVMRIRDAIEGLSSTPPIGDIKPMQGYNDGRKDSGSVHGESFTDWKRKKQ